MAHYGRCCVQIGAARKKKGKGVKLAANCLYASHILRCPAVSPPVYGNFDITCRTVAHHSLSSLPHTPFDGRCTYYTQGLYCMLIGACESDVLLDSRRQVKPAHLFAAQIHQLRRPYSQALLASTAVLVFFWFFFKRQLRLHFGSFPKKIKLSLCSSTAMCTIE